MKAWASTTYDDSSHDPQWYNPAFGVVHVPKEELEAFNRLVLAGDHRRKTTAALYDLERSATELHELISKLEGFRSTAGDLGSRWDRVRFESNERGRQLTDDELKNVPGLRTQDVEWLRKLYKENKALHVKGIGGPRDGSLNERWRAAVEAVEEEREILQAARVTRWRWAGHLTAVVFAATGLLFLADFYFSAGVKLLDRFAGARKSVAGVHGWARHEQTRLQPDTSAHLQRAMRPRPDRNRDSTAGSNRGRKP
jgi:hypothetical protein